MGLRTNHFTPFFDGFVTLRAGKKVISKKKLSRGTVKIGQLIAPCNYTIEVIGQIADARDKHPIGAGFSVTWYLELDKEGNYKTTNAPKVNDPSAPKFVFISGKISLFDEKGLTRINAIATSDPPHLQKKRKTIKIEFTYDIKVEKKEEKPRKTIPFWYTIGPYITNKFEFEEIDKKVKKPKGAFYPIEFRSKFTKIIKKHNVAKIEVLGVADSRGTELKNLKLGLNRAKKFVEFIQAIPNFDAANVPVLPRAIGEAPGNTKEEDNPSQRVVMVRISAYKK